MNNATLQPIVAPLPSVALHGLGRFLLYVLAPASVFQAIAIGIGSAWYPPQTFVQLLLLMVVLLSVAHRGAMRVPLAVRPEMLAALLFLGYSLITAIVLPRYFSGLYILFPSGGLDEEIASPTPLAPTRANIGQWLYLLLNMAMMAGCLMFQSQTFDGKLRRAWLLGGTMALFFAYYQKLHFQFGLPFPASFLYSNEGYSVGYELLLDGYARVNSTFTEPSCAGNVFGAYFAYYVFEFLRTRHAGTLVAATAYAVAILFTASAVGYIEILGTFAMALMAMSRRPIVASGLILVGITVATLVYLLLPDLIASVLLNKATSGSFLNRTAADLFSIDLAVQTQFLGVGLGSNRPSSFFTYLLSNVGVPGLAIFTWFLYLLVRKPNSMVPDRSEQFGALRAALLVFVLGKVTGVPDINVWFMWLLIGLLCAIKVHAGAVSEPEESRYRSPSQITSS